MLCDSHIEDECAPTGVSAERPLNLFLSNPLVKNFFSEVFPLG